jgi:hypothetical protein
MLQIFWDQLKSVCHVQRKVFTFLPQKKELEGEGSVIVSKEENNVLVFEEKGHWLEVCGGKMAFTNALRWTLKEDCISLEHLRQGKDRAVFLFDLCCIDENRLESIRPHLCGSDCYSGKVFRRPKKICLEWTVQGPKKQETLLCDYF